VSNLTTTRKGSEEPPRRTAPLNEEPGFYVPACLWLYGNTRLLQAKTAYIPECFGPERQSPDELCEIERKAEQIVLTGTVLVCGIHNVAHQRAACVPLRWGAPRIVVFSGGFRYHLGEYLETEPFPVARLWRYEWDKNTDLAISIRSPPKLPSFAKHNGTIDKLIEKISMGEIPGLLFDKTVFAP
jgi:hypothetical protein